MQYELLRCVSEDAVWNIHEMFRSPVHRVNGVRISSDAADCHDAHYNGERGHKEAGNSERESLSGSVTKVEVSMGRKR